MLLAVSSLGRGENRLARRSQPLSSCASCFVTLQGLLDTIIAIADLCLYVSEAGVIDQDTQIILLDDNTRVQQTKPYQAPARPRAHWVSDSRARTFWIEQDLSTSVATCCCLESGILHLKAEQ